MHAAAMLIWASTGDVARNAIGGVQFSRANLRPEWVIEDFDEYVVPEFDSTHRSLQTEPLETASIVLATCTFEEWMFSRAELVPIIQDWIARGVIRTRFRAVAQRLVELS